MYLTENQRIAIKRARVLLEKLADGRVPLCEATKTQAREIVDTLPSIVSLQVGK